MDEIETLAAYCMEMLSLETADFGREFGYACLPLCIIEAVWSTGIRYGGVQKVITDYCAYFGLNDERALEQHGVEEMLAALQGQTVGWAVREVFHNVQPTSVRKGILKVEAVYLFAEVLQRHGMNRVADIPKITSYETLPGERKKAYAREILAIPGQKGGISLCAFYMLTGSSGLVKPDRMTHGFLHDALLRDVTDDDLQRLLSHACRLLHAEFPLLTPRLLDHQIWKYQAARDHVD